MGGNAAAEARKAASEGVGVADYCEGDRRYEQTLCQMRVFGDAMGWNGNRGMGYEGMGYEGYG